MVGLILVNKGGIIAYNRIWSFQWFIIGPVVLFPRQTVLMNSPAPVFVQKSRGAIF